MIKLVWILSILCTEDAEVKGEGLTRPPVPVRGETAEKE